MNPLADHDDLARVAAECGFRIERITYYTPVVGAFVENVLVRMAEQFLARRALDASRRRAAPRGAADDVTGATARGSARRARPRRRASASAASLYWAC